MTSQASVRAALVRPVAFSVGGARYAWSVSDAHAEIDAGERFAFGANWQRFLANISPDTIDKAVQSLRDMLGVGDLSGRTFLDAGSGSGLFSLAAHRLGARVTSFDFDPQSVACTEELRRRYGDVRGGETWDIKTGSVLDAGFMDSLGTFDVVYSWGVLHHTGDMWSAIDRAAAATKPHGLLYIAIYNDQGWRSKAWTVVKKRYNSSGPLTRALIVFTVGIRAEARRAVLRAVERVVGTRTLAETRTDRGMARFTDLIDWVGGWPFEVARPEQIFDHLTARSFVLKHLSTRGGSLGCNEFVFENSPN